MDIRPATLSDLNACLSLNHNCETNHVWQMQDQSSRQRVNVTFDVVRLPRDLEQLVEDWQLGEGFFVAEVDGEVRGYVDTLANPWQGVAWVANLAVDKPYRRRRLGIALVHSARQWARDQGLHSMMFEATTKNYPALNLYQKLGASFCGFNDHYYLNQDIALFFVLAVR